MNELCEECQGGGCKWCDNTGLAHELRYHPHDPKNISVADIEEGRYAHRTVGHLQGKKGKAGVGDIDPRADAREIMNDTPRGRQMQTDVEIPIYEGQYLPSFGGVPMAGAGKRMVNPAAEIFRRGNPMDIAWRLLKSPEDRFEEVKDDGN